MSKLQEAVKAYKNWQKEQIKRNKAHLIGNEDMILFAKRFKVEPEEMRELLEQKQNSDV